MGTRGVKRYSAILGVKIEDDVLEKFIANAEACKSTKDIVLRELVYAFNRYCEGGRFPVLQRLEISSPGYMLSEDGQSVYDASAKLSPHHGHSKVTTPPKPPDKSQRFRGDGPHRAVPKSA